MTHKDVRITGCHLLSFHRGSSGLMENDVIKSEIIYDRNEFKGLLNEQLVKRHGRSHLHSV